MKFFVILMFFAQNCFAGKNDHVFKTTGKALYKASGIEKWVNEQRNYLKQQENLKPLYAIVLLGEYYMDRRYETRINLDKRRFFLLEIGINQYFLPEKSKISFVVTFY